MPEQTPKSGVAFIPAALALLVMPVLVMFGLTAFGQEVGMSRTTAVSGRIMGPASGFV